MPPREIPRQLLQESLDWVHEFGSAHAASREDHIDIPPGTIKHRYDRAIKLGMKPGDKNTFRSEIMHLKNKVKILEAEIKAKEIQEFNAEEIKQKFLDIRDIEYKPPEWILRAPAKSKNSPGIPCLLVSDIHCGETIFPQQVGGKNHYNLRVFHERMRTLANNTIDILNNHVVNPNYEGFVLMLGGDLVSGDIHMELSNTNDAPIMVAVKECIESLIWLIDKILDNFPKVFIAGVTGNHGRTSMKPRHKNRVFENFDWLILQMIKKHYHKENRITFLIPDGSDAQFKVYNHTYLLSHGDSFRGGDGIIGCLGPIVRGDFKKRARQSQIGQDYDTLVVGHFHTLIQMDKVIVNGSLSGYSEYAYINNFPYEEPRQALWMTHPHRGITISMPVHVQEPDKGNNKADWVSVMK